MVGIVCDLAASLALPGLLEASTVFLLGPSGVADRLIVPPNDNLGIYSIETLKKIRNTITIIPDSAGLRSI